MLHAVVGVYILAFAGGVALIVVSMLASRRLAVTGLRDFTLLFTASTLILVVEALKTYERAVAGDFGVGLHISAVVLSVLGNAGLTWFLFVLALRIINASPSRRLKVALGVLAVVVAGLGGIKEAAELVWPQPGPGILLWNLDYVALLALHIGAGAILLAGYTNIEHPRLRLIIRAFLIYLGVFSLLAIAQLVAEDLPSAPPLIHDFPLEELLSYLVFSVAALVTLGRYFASPAQRPASLELSQDFISRFGISGREQEIIEMMSRGFSNSAIAEKLFISTVTVKNHIYHIYRKTGVRNKVQLLNLMNSLK